MTVANVRPNNIHSSIQKVLNIAIHEVVVFVVKRAIVEITTKNKRITQNLFRLEKIDNDSRVVVLRRFILSFGKVNM